MTTDNISYHIVKDLLGRSRIEGDEIDHYQRNDYDYLEDIGLLTSEEDGGYIIHDFVDRAHDHILAKLQLALWASHDVTETSSFTSLVKVSPDLHQMYQHDVMHNRVSKWTSDNCQDRPTGTPFYHALMDLITRYLPDLKGVCTKPCTSRNDWNLKIGFDSVSGVSDDIYEREKAGDDPLWGALVTFDRTSEFISNGDVERVVEGFRSLKDESRDDVPNYEPWDRIEDEDVYVIEVDGSFDQSDIYDRDQIAPSVSKVSRYLSRRCRGLVQLSKNVYLLNEDRIDHALTSSSNRGNGRSISDHLDEGRQQRLDNEKDDLEEKVDLVIDVLDRLSQDREMVRKIIERVEYPPSPPTEKELQTILEDL